MLVIYQILWSSWNIQGKDFDDIAYKEKIIEIINLCLSNNILAIIVRYGKFPY